MHQCPEIALCQTATTEKPSKAGHAELDEDKSEFRAANSSSRE